MGLVALRIFIDTTRDPTSHNLWPLEIVMWSALSGGWVLFLRFQRRVFVDGRTP